MAAIITRNRRLVAEELPDVLSDTDLLAWGQSLVDVHAIEWTPDPGAAPGPETQPASVDDTELVVAEAADEIATVVPLSALFEESTAAAAIDEPAAPVEPADAQAAPVGAVEAEPVEAELVEEGAVAETGLEPTLEVAAAVAVEPEIKPARISTRRRQLVAMRQQAAAEAAARRSRPRSEPLRGYRPEPIAAAPSVAASVRSRGSDARSRLQERLARVRPVAHARDGQWPVPEENHPWRSVAAVERAKPGVIRVRLADAD